MYTLAVLAEESHAEGLPPIAWGIGALAILMSLLITTLIFGKGRPHS